MLETLLTFGLGKVIDGLVNQPIEKLPEIIQQNPEDAGITGAVMLLVAWLTKKLVPWVNKKFPGKRAKIAKACRLIATGIEWLLEYGPKIAKWFKERAEDFEKKYEPKN